MSFADGAVTAFLRAMRVGEPDDADEGDANNGADGEDGADAIDDDDDDDADADNAVVGGRLNAPATLATKMATGVVIHFGASFGASF